MNEQDKDMEAAAKAYGHRIATPMLRSMWPSMSRGAFADFLACAFGEGWKAASERKDAHIEVLLRQRKDAQKNVDRLDKHAHFQSLEIQSLQSKLAALQAALDNVFGDLLAAHELDSWIVTAESIAMHREAIARIKGEK